MKAALFCIVLSAASAAGERAFVELAAARDTFYAGEPVLVRVRVGVDREFFREFAAPLFQQRMELPVQVTAPWLRRSSALPAKGPERLRFVLGEEIVAGARAPDALRGGRAFTVVEAARRIDAPAPGPLRLEGPSLRYAHATRFEEDFVQGRVALDPRDAFARGEPLAIRVLPLPEEGRPPGFSGAIGRFSVEATADRAEVEAGSVVRVTLRIRGEEGAEGNLATLVPPRLDALPGFHLYGAIDDRAAPVRTIVCELAPLAAATAAIPAIEFAFFDPAPPAAYRVARTAPIALAVRPRPGEAEGESRAPRNEPLPARSPAEPKAAGRGLPAAVAAAALAAGFAAALLVRRRRRRARAVSPAAARAAAAFEALRLAAASGRGDRLSDAFAGFLASRLDCAPAAVIAPDLPRRLEGAGLDRGSALRAARAMESLVAARYGAGPAAPLAPEAIRELEEIARDLARRLPVA